MNRVRNISLAGIVMLLTLTATTVHAQSFFERGKNLLKGLDNTTAPSSVLSTLTSDEISGGLREALRVGAERVVNTLGQTDGFNKASDIHIPLPNTLKTAWAKF